MSFLAISIRKLKQAPTSIIVFWAGLGGLLCASMYLIIEIVVTDGRKTFDDYTMRQYLFAFGAASFDMLGISMMCLAYQSDKSGFVALLSYLNIVWAYLADILIFEESLNTIEFLATLTILIVALGSTLYKLKNRPIELDPESFVT